MKAVAAPVLSAPATALLKDKRLPLDAHAEVASLSERGDPAERSAEGASLSEDGRHVAFHSAALNLVEGVPRDTKQVYVRDRRTGEVGVASMASNGEPGNEDSYDANLSSDAHYVAFTSRARNLVPEGAPRDLWQIYRHDMTSDETVRVSPAEKSCQMPAMSGDGQRIAFRAQDGPGWDNNADVYVVDVGGTAKRINTVRDGVRDPAISANGRYVAYSGGKQIYVYDCQTGKTETASTTAAENYSPSLSSDGRTVAWAQGGKIMVRDLDHGSPEMLSEADSNAYHPSISGDGRYVAFESDSPKSIGMRSVYVHDRQQHRTEMMKAVNQAGQSGNPQISTDGKMVAWESGYHVMPQDFGMGVLIGHNLAAPEASHEAFDTLTQQVEAEQKANAVDGIEEGDGFVKINGLTLVALERPV